MSAEQNQISPNWNKLEEEEMSDTSMSEILLQTLKNWKWLLLSVCVCMGIGLFYILKTPLTFTESAEVIIKNDSEGQTASIAGGFNDLGLFKNNTVVQNEIATMASPDVMMDVVKDLNLNVDYSIPGTFHNTAIYGSTLPVIANFIGIPYDEMLSFSMQVSPKGEITISKLKKYDNAASRWIKYDKTYTGSFGGLITTDAGGIVINPTKYYKAGVDLDIYVNKKNLASTVNSYTNRLKVTLADDESTVVDLKISDQNRQRADDILNAVISVYNQNWIKEKNQIAVSTSDFIDDRLGVIETELGNVESDISSYKSANLVPDVQKMAESYIKESQDLSKQLLELEGKLQAARYLRTRLTTAGEGQEALPANTTLENPSLQAQIKEYNELVLKRKSLDGKTSDKNPVVQTLNEQIAQMRGAILGSVDNAIQGLEGQVRGVQSARGMATNRIASSPTQAKYLLSVERQQKVKENLYLFLLQKREDNALSQAFTAYNTRIIKKPGGDGVPTAPKKGFILCLSFIIGILIPFGYNYFIEKWNTKVRDRKDVESMATPLIGEIPLAKTRKCKIGNTNSLVVRNGSRDIVNEAFRVLRTNVEFTKVNKDGCNVLAVTSFNPGSGKSFIAMNLGATLSLKGKKVLIIDGDIRRGTSSSYVDSPNIGLSDYLAGHKKDFDNLIVKYPEMNNLYVLPVGSVPPNPTELLETPLFGEMINKLRPNYDYIIIDCPPVEVVADAQIIDLLVDSTIFVVRTGLLERSMLSELDRFYHEKKYSHMSFILNGTSTTRTAYGYSDKYTAYGE